MNISHKTWTVVEIIKTTSDFFNKRHIENPRLNAEQLLSHVLNISRVDLYLQFERILTEKEIDLYRKLIQRRSSDEPLQYILGEAEFMGLKFKVSPAALIPRPETELLVEKVIETAKKIVQKNLSILDIGTGSGCIAISLAHFLPNSRISATDISQPALDLSQTNAELNNVKNIKFLNHNILEADELPAQLSDIIVSNPPYISINEMQDLSKEIKNFEPEIALTDNNSGLKFYEKILSLIANDMKCKFVFMEMNSNLKDQILEITRKFNFKCIEVLNDLNNLPRILKIEI